MLMKFLSLLVIIFFLFPGTLRAQEVRALGGALQQLDFDANTFTWQLEYKEGITEGFEYSFTHLNEGHLPGNHRDGHAFQLWVDTQKLDRRLSLAGGVGPYFSYNTSIGNQNQENEHGWGALLSLSATWYTESRWLYELRTNFVGAANGVDTVAILFGIGYQLAPPPSPGPRPEPPPQSKKTTNNELTVFIGETIVHNGGSDRDSLAAGIEYRKGILKNVDWTATFLNEGRNDVTSRNGIMTQLWVVRPFMNEVLTLGIGAGPYFAIDSLREPEKGKDNDIRAYAAVTMTASYRFDPSWGVRLFFHRIITDYDRDADVLTAGAAYLF